MNPSFYLTADDIRQYLYCNRILYFRRLRNIKPDTTYLIEIGSRFHHETIKIKDYKTKPRKKETILSEELKTQWYDIKEYMKKYFIEKEKKNKYKEYYDVSLFSQELGLYAKLDLYLNVNEEIIPVEIKSAIMNKTTPLIKKLPKDLQTLLFQNKTLIITKEIEKFYRNMKYHPIENTSIISSKKNPPWNFLNQLFLNAHIGQIITQSILLENSFHTLITRALLIYAGLKKIIQIPITTDMKYALIDLIKIIQWELNNEILPKPMATFGKCEVCDFLQYCKRI